MIVYSAFILYATYRVFEPVFAAGTNYAAYAGYYLADNGHYHYASPFGTPDFTWAVPGFLYNLPYLAQAVRSPAFLILPFPAGFRMTCYYYRKSYYRAFVARPAGCAVPANKGFDYKGERGILVLQNLHRWFLYAAIVITLFLAWDAIRSIVTPNGLYFGLGSALMLVNVGFLMAYTFGCHSFRHLIGGKLDCFSCDGAASTRYSLWTKVTVLNDRHALWAWLSLFTVAGVDLYIRYVVMSDPLGIAAALKSAGVPL
ncbi:MAG: hypothetical protein QOE90_345 [Thermoplasmata archaeon]|nr:hypothetical protein [Thermoplasmata archaeon]